MRNFIAQFICALVFISCEKMALEEHDIIPLISRGFFFFQLSLCDSSTTTYSIGFSLCQGFLETDAIVTREREKQEGG